MSSKLIVSAVLLLFVGSILVSSCMKPRDRIIDRMVTGQVVSWLDGEAIPYAKVVVYKATSIYCSSPDRLECRVALDSGYADAKGWFDISYQIEANNTVMFIKAFKEQYLVNTSASLHNHRRDSVIAYLTPQTTYKLTVIDEGMSHIPDYYAAIFEQTYLVPGDTIFQFPLDTTIFVGATPERRQDGSPRSIRYLRLIDLPGVVGNSGAILVDTCPPFDTCEVIKYL